jgi:hypothetical protein
MNVFKLVAIVGTFPVAVSAQSLTPTDFTVQGQLKLSGVPVTGRADMSFGLFDAETSGTEVAPPVGLSSVEVTDGLFSVQLDFGAEAFDGNPRWLEIEVEFPSGAGNWTTLKPRQPLTAIPYALQSRGMFCNDAGEVGIGTDLPEERLHVSTGDLRVDGNLKLYQGGSAVVQSRNLSFGKVFDLKNNDSGGTVVQLGASGSDGAGFFALKSRTGTTTTIELDGDTDGVSDDDASGAILIRSVGGGPGGELEIANDDGFTTIYGVGGASDEGGTLELFNESQDGTILLDADDNNDGTIRIRDADGNDGILLRADHASSVAGEISLFNDLGYETVEIIGAEGVDNGAQIRLRTADGTETIQLDGEYGTDGGGYLRIDGGDNDPAVYLEGSGSSRNDATLRVNNIQPSEGMAAYLTNNSNFATVHFENNGTGETLWLENNGGGHLIVARTPARWEFWVDGDGYTNSRVLRIHGGADLSEGFDVRPTRSNSADKNESPAITPVPGMVVSIDSENPGKLVVSSEPYDKTVAGIISGAGGVNPGMLMGQTGSHADGDYPVALTGRVYCLCDATGGAIRPGDMLTTSGVPGHAMKVGHHGRARGATIGKAMTALADGRGLVLVLVTLQ